MNLLGRRSTTSGPYTGRRANGYIAFSTTSLRPRPSSRRHTVPDERQTLSDSSRASDAWTQIFRPMLVNDLECDKRCEVRLSKKLVQMEKIFVQVSYDYFLQLK